MVNFVFRNNFIENLEVPNGINKIPRINKNGKAAFSAIQSNPISQRIQIIRNPNWDNKKIKEIKAAPLEDGGGVDGQAENHPQDKAAHMQRILQSLALHQDDEEILIHLQNRSLIGKKLNLFFLFWQETNDLLQNLKNLLFVENDFNKKNPRNIENFNNVIDHFGKFFFKALQSFGVDDKTLPSNSYWKNPNDINHESVLAIKNLEIIFNHQKNDTTNRFNASFPGNTKLGRRTNIGKKALDFKRNAALINFEEANAKLETIKKTNRLFLKLFESEHSCSFLLTGEYAFAIPQVRDFGVDFSNAKVKKRVLKELIDLSNFVDSSLQKYFSSKNSNALKEFVNECQNIISNTVSNEIIEKIMKSFFQIHFGLLGKILSLLDQSRDAERGNLDFLANQPELNKIIENLIIEDTKVQGNYPLDHLNLKIKYLNLFLELQKIDCLILDEAIVFIENTFYEKISPTACPHHRLQHHAIPLFYERFKEMQTFQDLNGNEISPETLPFSKSDEILYIEAQMSELLQSFMLSFGTFFEQTRLKNWQEQEKIEGLIQIFHGNERLVNLWFSKLLNDEFREEDRFLELFIPLLNFVDQMNDILAGHPKKLTLEEGQALFRYLSVNYLSPVVYKLLILNEINLFAENANLFLPDNTHASLMNGLIDKWLNAFADAIYKNCSHSEIASGSNIVELGCVNEKGIVENALAQEKSVDNMPLEFSSSGDEDAGIAASSLPQVNEQVEEVVKNNQSGQIDASEDSIPKNAKVSSPMDPSKVIKGRSGQNQQINPKRNQPLPNINMAMDPDDGGSNEGVQFFQKPFISLLPKNPRYRDVVDLLKKTGFVEARVRGHRIFKDQSGHTVPLPRPHHGKGSQVAPGTYSSVLRLMQSIDERKAHSQRNAVPSGSIGAPVRKAKANQGRARNGMQEHKGED